MIGSLRRTGTVLLLLMGLLQLETIAFAHGPRSIRVHEGDTLIAIAKRHRVTVAAIKRRNGLKSDFIRIGQRLKLPQKAKTKRTKNRRAAGRRKSKDDKRPENNRNDMEEVETVPPTKETRAQVRSRRARLGGGERYAAARLLQGRAPKAWQKVVHESVQEFEKQRESQSTEADNRSGTLASPVPHGVLSRGFGSGRRSYHLALDIAARSGTPVRAAENGVVVYAGRGFRGFGRIVILLHKDGWVTGYAHNHRNHVSAGELVARGGTHRGGRCIGACARSTSALHVPKQWKILRCEATPPPSC